MNWSTSYHQEKEDRSYRTSVTSQRRPSIANKRGNLALVIVSDERSQMTSSPLVSVVMPVRNGMTYIDEALLSARTALRTFDHEIVIADGGSDDGTAQYLAAAPHGARLVSKNDNSMYEGLNKAIEAALGRYILWLNSDDILFPDGVVELVRTGLQSETCDVVTAEAVAEKDDEIIWRSDNAARPISTISALFGVPVMNCRLLRRSAILRLGGFRPDLGLGADRELLYRLARAGTERANIEKVAYIYRVHPGSRTLAGSWESYIAVHQANLQLAVSLKATASDVQERKIIDAYQWLSTAALVRAFLASGQIHNAFSKGLNCAWRSMSSSGALRAVCLLRQFRGRAAGC